MKRLQFCSYLSPSLLPVYELVTEEVGRRIGLETELVVETSSDRFERDESEVCFVCSLPCVVLERRGLDIAAPVAAPVLIGDRYRGRPVYFSDVIVHRDAPFRSFTDLRGHSWAYNEALSHSGYGIARYHMVGLGETAGFFSEVIEAGSHDEAIRMVACDEVDTSAIDSQVLSIAFHNDAGLAERLRVVEVLGPSTIQPVTVSRRVSNDLRDAIREVLVTMADDPAVREQLALGLVERFTPVDERSYDDIREMVDACERAGFVELR
jgi:phosphonate transport system substrate-binding protein